jgi:hypothetical protein
MADGPPTHESLASQCTIGTHAFNNLGKLKADVPDAASPGAAQP